MKLHLKIIKSNRFFESLDFETCTYGFRQIYKAITSEASKSILPAIQVL